MSLERCRTYRGVPWALHFLQNHCLGDKLSTHDRPPPFPRGPTLPHPRRAPARCQASSPRLLPLARLALSSAFLARGAADSAPSAPAAFFLRRLPRSQLKARRRPERDFFLRGGPPGLPGSSAAGAAGGARAAMARGLGTRGAGGGGQAPCSAAPMRGGGRRWRRARRKKVWAAEAERSLRGRGQRGRGRRAGGARAAGAAVGGRGGWGDGSSAATNRPSPPRWLCPEGEVRLQKKGFLDPLPRSSRVCLSEDPRGSSGFVRPERAATRWAWTTRCLLRLGKTFSQTPRTCGRHSPGSGPHWAPASSNCSVFLIVPDSFQSA